MPPRALGLFFVLTRGANQQHEGKDQGDDQHLNLQGRTRIEKRQYHLGLPNLLLARSRAEATRLSNLHVQGNRSGKAIADVEIEVVAPDKF